MPLSFVNSKNSNLAYAICIWGTVVFETKKN